MASIVRGAVAAPARTEVKVRSGAWLTDLLLLCMALIWGANFSIVKYGMRDLAPLAFNSLRITLAAAALFLVAVFVRERWPSRRDALALLGLGVLGNCVYQIFFIEGIARTQPGIAALVLAAAPAVIALMGRFTGVERITPRGAGGIALSIVGVGLVMFGAGGGESGEVTLLGNLLMFAGCICWAAFTVLLKPYTHRVHGVQLSALTMTGGALPMLLVATPSLGDTRFAAVSPAAWGAVAYSGLAALVIAYLIWYRGVRVIGPTRTAMYSNLQPFIALLIAWRIFGHVPSLFQGAGAACILAGILLTRW